MAFNIKSRAISPTATLHLRDPETDELMYADDEQTLPLEIVVSGQASKEYQDWQDASNRKSVARAGKVGKDKPLSAEEQRAVTVSFLAAMTRRMNNFDYNGEALDNSVTIGLLYSDPGMSWVGDAVAALVFGDKAPFLQK